MCTSSDTGVATIDAEGLITGEGAGTTEITVTFDGQSSDPVTLTVTEGEGAALQWWAILAIIAALLALAVLLYAIGRRRGGEQPEEAE